MEYSIKRKVGEANITDRTSISKKNEIFKKKPCDNNNINNAWFVSLIFYTKEYMNRNFRF